MYTCVKFIQIVIKFLYEDALMSLTSFLPMVTFPLLFILLSYMIMYFVFKLILRNSKPFKLLIFWLSGILFTPLLAYSVMCFPPVILNYSPQRSFDSELWLNDSSIRSDMIEDLLANNFLDNKSNVEVLELLGEESEYCSVFFSEGDLCFLVNEAKYYRDHTNGEFLIIWFTNDKVSNYIVREVGYY